MKYGTVRLTRVIKTNQMTLGVLTALNLPPLMTLELPWRDNERNVSCVPEGTYPAVVDKHRILGDVIRLSNVEGRDGILIHVGNYTKDTQGCILVGKNYATMNPDSDDVLVAYSKEAMQTLLSYLRSYCPKGFQLIIGATAWPSSQVTID